MKQLFLKSNILHIRTNEGVFEVSNPEIIKTAPRYNNWGKKDRVEWPYGVELNWRIAISTARDTKYTSCTEEYAKSNPGFHSYAIARLLPKEEKKHEWTTDEIMSMVENKEEKKENKICITSHGPASTQAESAYKEFEASKPQERDTTLLKLLALKRFTEDRIKNLIYFDEDKQAWSEDQKTAPSESQEEQEELWKEARHYIDVWRIEELFKRFTIRRNAYKD